VFVGRVVEVRTIGQGKRLPEGEGINHAVHKPIATSSPIRSHDESSPPTEEPRADLLRQSQLTDYIHHLNRHPGRQVEASVAAASVPGGVSLDFMVFEPDPLTLYYEIGNTGTPQENGLRQRFGLVHTQFTGNDDVLTIEYVTSNFKTTNAVLGNYQFRVTEDNRVRAGVMATWNKFVSDQFGQDFIDYSGHSWSVGPQMVFNIYQDGPFFLDLVPGVNYQRVKVTNHLLGDDGQAPFILPYAQLQASRQDQSGLFQGMIGLEGSPLSQDVQELTRLGRINPAERWARLNFSASLSTFLEPLLNPVGWADPETPGTSTLAHELSLRFSGQQSFGSRLVPQFQSILGGLYSVRGYQQSVVAGDNSLFGSVEYRFHLPRTFAVEPEPIEFLGSPFRSSPQYVYGRPDWDLIFKAFFDAGYVYQNGDVGFETNNTLLGAGIGLEFLYKSNLRIQLDWGVALHDLSFGLAEAGSSRLYVTGTFLW
jgi:hemolysin activation/secretion protein